jgi:hypothetical protein
MSKKKIVKNSWKSRTCVNCNKRFSTINKFIEHAKRHDINTNSLSNLVATPNYEELYRNLKNDNSRKRYEIINDWMKSVATINDAIAHAIGDIGGGR